MRFSNFMYHNSKQTLGFTLLELMVTVAVGAVLMAIAVPGFKDMIRSNRLTTYTNELVTSLNLARSEAVKRGVNVVVGAKNQGANNYWSGSVGSSTSTGGWDVFVVGDGRTTNLFYQPAKNDILIRTYAPLPNSFILAGNNNFANAVQFRPDGTSNNIGSLAICADVPSPTPTPPYAPLPYTSKLIIVNAVGRVRLGQDQYDSSGNTNPDGIPEKSSLSGANVLQLTNCMSP